ncbi:MAG TPA: cation transporter, partial [Kineosporiaceae bacterium]|nr:cation transporter [Kineosporiaceae bacterium]
MTTHSHSAPGTGLTATVHLTVGGMTCASCAARIEKKLNRMAGVAASVNFATETADVSYDPALASPAELIATVEATGYTARLPEPPQAVEEPAARGEEAPDEADGLRKRVLVCAVLTVPVVAMAMIPVLQFRFWQWLSLTLAAPVVIWGAWPFHRAAA